MVCNGVNIKNKDHFKIYDDLFFKVYKIMGNSKKKTADWFDNYLIKSVNSTPNDLIRSGNLLCLDRFIRIEFLEKDN
jgi:hypothetical protein